MSNASPGDRPARPISARSTFIWVIIPKKRVYNPNALFGRHPDARETHANLHFLWLLEVVLGALPLIALDPAEHAAWGLFDRHEIARGHRPVAPWIEAILERIGGSC